MSKFLQLLAFEMRLYMKRISTHVYFLILAAIAFFYAVVAGGAIKGAAIGIGGGMVKANSPFVITLLMTVMSVFAIIIVAAVAGNAVYRDYEADIHALFFTCPVSKGQYLLSRFVGSLLTNTYIMCGLAVGMALGFVMPFLDKESLGPLHAWAFVHPFLLIIIPNLIWTSAVFFALAAYTRQMLPNYLGAIVMLVAYNVAAILSSNVERQQIAALVDPFGITALSLLTRYWTASQQNTDYVPLAGVLLANRALWTAIGLLIFFAALVRFRFRHVASERQEKRRVRQDWEEQSSAYHGALARRGGLSGVVRSYGAGARLSQFLSMTRRSFMTIVKNVYFYAILAVGALFIVIGMMSAGQIYGTTTWPVTYQVAELLGGSYFAVGLIMITFYAGELVWQERDRRMQQVHDALPIPTWVPFLGKFCALLLIMIVIQAALMATGIGIQAAQGYRHFELMLYVKELFGLQMINWALLIALVMLIHAAVDNKYFGHFAVIVFYAGWLFMSQLGLEHRLWRYAGATDTTYSDMNLFGPFLGPLAWFKIYWGGVALLFAVGTNLLWMRGQENTVAWRLNLARRRLSRSVAAFAVAGLFVAVVAGGYIFWNTNIRNTYRTSFERAELQARYERDYKQYEKLPQPRIIGSKVDVTLWPKTGSGELKGELNAVNKTGVPVPALHVQLPSEADIRSIKLDPPAKETKRDEDLGYYIWTFEQPLQPGQHMKLTYELAYTPEGFTNSGASTTIVENGTFINSGLLPSFGYNENGELGDDDTRRKHGLPPKERMAPVDDLQARMNTYISSDADWIAFDATVCTDPDQQAIAPGYLKEEFDRGDRRCFHYAMDSPILNFYSFLSARYTVDKDAWNDVAIEVWRHHEHDYNVKTMIDATKKALEYYTTHFTPYQHRQVRIVEFPRYASFAQSFPNTIPYSESIGFIARVKNPQEDIDYPFYVTAHEVAHQWFAHQVIGGNVQGSTLLSESLSQYAALKVMEQEYGKPMMVKFLKYEMDNYLRGRSVERKKELPLLLVENQQYIHYNKGSVVLYALADYIGDDKFNGAIKHYLERTRFQWPPYTNSLEFLAELRAVTPPDMQYLLDDMLASITLYDTRVTSATTEKQADGKWKTTLQIDAKKLRADQTGNEVEVPMNDLVDIGVFQQGNTPKLQDLKPLTVERRRLAAGKSEVTFLSDKRPDKAGVDPRLLLIDRIQDDNMVTVKDGKAPAS